MSVNVIFAAICWFCSLTFVAIAIWAFKRKDPMHFWSGITVSPDEIADIPAYNRANGLMWTIYAGCMVLTGMISLFSIAIGGILLGVVSVLGLVVLIIVYKRIYNKYKNTSTYKTFAATSDIRPTKAVVIITIAITIIVSIFVFIMIHNGSKDPVVNILINSIQINAMYGIDIDYTEIVGISLIEKSMSEIGVGTRTNGYGGIGQALKGNFKSEIIGETLLFVQSKSSPTIKIERAGRDVYISFDDSERTRLLYQELTAVIAK